MLIGRDRGRQFPLAHDDERNAVRQAPSLVGPFGIKSKGLLEKRPVNRHYSDVGRSVTLLDEPRRRLAVEGSERIADFDENRFGYPDLVCFSYPRQERAG